MKRIYMRAGMSPLEPVSIGDAIDKNMIRDNSGNLVYQYSVFRAVMQPGTTFDARDFMDVLSAPGGVEQVNETCDIALLTLANAFRKGYRLRELADMVRRLTIPCVVVGCGVQAASYEEIRAGLPFDDDVRLFIDAVLDKSALVGLRGEFTADYLKRLGYLPEKHYTVIGCPSLFLNGPQMPAPKTPAITGETRFSINTRPSQRAQMHRLIFDAERKYPNYHLVLQRLRELRMIAYGAPNRAIGQNNDATGYYPFAASHPDVRGGRIIGFTEARTWFRYMRDIDYSFGSRMHGNVAAVISGVPAFVFTSDTRTEEICRYANIPFMPMEDLKGGEDIRAILEGADFAGVCRGYGERFAHYVDFLDKNGVEHIWQGGGEPEVVPFDEAMKAVPEGGFVRSGCMGGGEALRRRLGHLAGKVIGKLKG